MNLIALLLIIDLVLLVLSIKVIFRSWRAFGTALADHFYPQDILQSPFEREAVAQDLRHKINQLYAVVFILVGATVAIWYFSSDRI